MEKGDCIIHNPLVVHGSESNKSNINRGSFNFSMKSKQAKEDVAAINDHKKRLIYSGTSTEDLSEEIGKNWVILPKQIMESKNIKDVFHKFNSNLTEA